jgi:hypothetical protein
MATAIPPAPEPAEFLFEDGEWWYVQTTWHQRLGRMYRRRTRAETRTCSECGNEFLVQAWHAPRAKFCSRECFGKKHSRATAGRTGTRWKGGRRYTRSGYVEVWIPHEERTSTKKYRLEHHIVMEQVLGRGLERHERVHHKNGVKDDNRTENLELWTLGHSMPGVRVEDVKHCPTCTCGEH